MELWQNIVSMIECNFWEQLCCVPAGSHRSPAQTGVTESARVAGREVPGTGPMKGRGQELLVLQKVEQ